MNMILKQEQQQQQQRNQMILETRAGFNINIHWYELLPKYISYNSFSPLSSF